MDIACPETKIGIHQADLEASLAKLDEYQIIAAPASLCKHFFKI
jgi:hypothetical protein